MSLSAQKLCVIVSDMSNPYKNLSLEKFLLEGVMPGEVLLYLWRNERTVVCGRNQNIWKECNVEALLAAGGFPARRLSGGGAVYHDLGNLNFTFIACDAGYSLERQLEVITQAVRSFGIEAERTGRNDITAGGAKFSGNAFYKTNPNNFADRQVRRYHHGTLMIDVDRDMLSDYLNADKEKYTSKGVDSVKSRVCNLRDLNPCITASKMAQAMISAFEKVYGGYAECFAYPSGAGILHGLCPLKLSEKEEEQICETAAYFASDEWLYKNNIKFNVRLNHRFDFGDFDLRLNVEKGIIKETALYSDAMDETRILEIYGRLKGLEGTSYSPEAVKEAIGSDDISRALSLKEP